MRRLGLLVLLATAVMAGIRPTPVAAQSATGSTVNSQYAGVVVDARGVLEKRVFPDPSGQLMRQKIAAAKQSLNRDVLVQSKMRKVSLNRLEAVVREKNGVISDEMRHLAGMLRAKYVFYYPESKDIVLAGPAEGWVTDTTGRVIGITSGRPVLQLQDLVVALRSFSPRKTGPSVIGCSIDPTPEGLAAMQQYLRTVGRNFSESPSEERINQLVDGLRQSLGMQKVTVSGVPDTTHFAQVLVEADYRMKLIGIGLEQPPVRMVQFIDQVNPAAISRNALFRWYFVPDYHCVRLSEDRLAAELVGDGVKLVGEDELVAEGGQRKGATRSTKASIAFVTSFTKRYPQLADRSPVYAELRNLIDLAVLAAHIQKEDLYGKSGWQMEYLGDEKSFAVETYTAPKMVASTVAARLKGQQLMTPIGGGVHIEAAMALKPENVLKDDESAVTNLHNHTKVKLAPGQWWWD